MEQAKHELEWQKKNASSTILWKFKAYMKINEALQISNQGHYQNPPIGLYN